VLERSREPKYVRMYQYGTALLVIQVWFGFGGNRFLSPTYHVNLPDLAYFK
jgi:hypothetical protein